MIEADSGVKERLASVRKTLANLSENVELVAVSKTFPNGMIYEAVLAGQRVFGENYAQEGCAKVDWFRTHYPYVKLDWHFIGPLQSNKAKIVAERFDWVDSVDRVKIAKRLNDHRPDNMPALNVLIQVNIDSSKTKSGVKVDELHEVAREIAKFPRLKLRGLMAIPAPGSTSEERRKPLAAMKALFDEMKNEFGFDTLSMGMSADMVEAVEEGATMVRIGSAIFGHRNYGTDPSGENDSATPEKQS